MFDGKTIHFLGIGGVSMSGIATILFKEGINVTGYDINHSKITNDLEDLGIKVVYKENLSLIDHADIIVYTAAISKEDAQYLYALKNNKEMYERSTFLGKLMMDYKNVLCISGTHGKSTTTGMVSQIFMEAGLNPTISIGAQLPLINSNVYVGDKNFFIVEACEYVDSFLEFKPNAEIILNIDNDHLDYFENIDNIIKSFNKFTTLLPSDGYLIVNNDDENTLKAVNIDCITYGIDNASNYMAKNINFNNLGHPSYDLYIDDNFICEIKLSVRGKHNIYNSLASIALSYQYNIDIDDIKKALLEYHGVGRRFEYLGTFNDAFVYDDYAHHPSEIKTTLDSVNNTKHNNCYAIFQGHTYSRTKEHLEDFASILSKFDNVIIAKIYPAREENIYNVKEEDLVDLIKNNNTNVIYLDTFEKIKEYLKTKVQKNDLIITIGAGPINEVAKDLIKEEK